MDDWQPISRGRPNVVGVDPRQPGRLDVRIPLVGSVNGEWTRVFEAPAGVTVPPPKVQGGGEGPEARISPPDSQLEAYVADVDERIARANREYERAIWPQIQEAKAAAAAEVEATARRLEDARRRAETL